ncbi:MAG: hypothetical protein JWO15_639 [Sphingomonadales bacterium]|nr:hypothetical protein [Sphingomonadales bacterium]
MSKMWNSETALRAQRRQVVDVDPTADQSDRYADGYAAARREAIVEVAAERAMLMRLIESATSIEVAEPEPLAQLLAETVLRLVEDVVGGAEIDATLLRTRALVLAEAIHGPAGPVFVRVHPDCVAMLDGLRDDICVCGDVAIDAGQIVATVGDRGAEDGVVSALDRVRVALGAMS